MTDHVVQVKERARAPLGASYWKLWTSSGLSNLADGVFKIALPLLAVQLTQSPTLIAGLSVAATLPWLLFALTAGALADRLDRRKLMLWANLSRAVLPAVLVAVVPALALGGSVGLVLVGLLILDVQIFSRASLSTLTPTIVTRVGDIFSLMNLVSPPPPVVEEEEAIKAARIADVPISQSVEAPLAAPMTCRNGEPIGRVGASRSCRRLSRRSRRGWTPTKPPQRSSTSRAATTGS